jgi:catechol 2,3-dioxygenase-like lactoylglutathione lyase family enzyme
MRLYMQFGPQEKCADCNETEPAMTIRTKRAPIDQLGMVTGDLDRAVKTWTEVFGVGPWQLYRNVVLDGVYLGQPVSVTIDVALGYRGREQIEFIEVQSTGPCPYLDAQGHAMAGLHHVAWIVDDLDGEARELEASGLVPVFVASNPAVRVIYFTDPAQPGILFELITGAGSRAQHDAGVAQAAAWDGSNLITEFDFAQAE